MYSVIVTEIDLPCVVQSTQLPVKRVQEFFSVIILPVPLPSILSVKNDREQTIRLSLISARILRCF